MDQDLNSLILQIRITEKVIKRLLKLDGTDSMIETKLAELENLVAKIPVDRQALVRVHQDEMASLWAQFWSRDGNSNQSQDKDLQRLPQNISTSTKQSSTVSISSSHLSKLQIEEDNNNKYHNNNLECNKVFIIFNCVFFECAKA